MDAGVTNAERSADARVLPSSVFDQRKVLLAAADVAGKALLGKYSLHSFSACGSAGDLPSTPSTNGCQLEVGDMCMLSDAHGDCRGPYPTAACRSASCRDHVCSPLNHTASHLPGSR